MLTNHKQLKITLTIKVFQITLQIVNSLKVKIFEIQMKHKIRIMKI